MMILLVLLIYFKFGGSAQLILGFRQTFDVAPSIVGVQRIGNTLSFGICEGSAGL